MSAEPVPLPYGMKSYEKLQMTDAERAFYRDLIQRRASRKQVSELIVPPRKGASFTVAQGQLVRIECHEDAQVADLNLFSRENPREQFSSSQSRAVHGSHLTKGHRLWSHPIYQRPMMTIIADSMDHNISPERARPHDLLFGMCDEKLYFRLTGRHGMPNCRENLTRAVTGLGFTAEDVHDPFNIFMATGLDQDGRLFYVPSWAKRGDHIEMYAEMDCICAVSACPGASSGPHPGGLKILIFDAAQL
jgi:uncharacterized protein